MINLKELTDQFINAAVGHGKGTLSGDSDRTNREHDRIIETLKSIHSADPSFEVLVPLLQNEDMSVRTWAATYLLPHQTERALKVLDDASKEKGLVAFSAGITANEWREGRLKLLID